MSSVDFYNQGLKNFKDGSIKRYDGQTGEFLDTFVPPSRGGLRSPVLFTFTETDPVTLAYTGDHLLAASVSPLQVTETLNTGPAQPLFVEMLAQA